MTPAEQLRKIKKEKRLSLAQIQANSGNLISDSYVGKILSGAVDMPSDEMQEALARGLLIPLDEVKRIFRGDPPPEIWTAYQILRTMESIMASPALTDVVKSLLEFEEPDIARFARSVRRYKKSKADA